MRILVAVDGSKQSEEAARALEHLPHAEEVIVLHVLDVPEPAYPMMMPEVARDIHATVERGMRDKGERLLTGITALLPPRTGPVIKRLEVGKPAELIVTIAQEQRVNLIVVGSRGLGPVKQRLLGSVSHRVLAHAACATLMVNRRMRALRQVLLPLQGPDDVEAAVAFLATRPFREAADVTILTVPPFIKPAWPAGASISEAVKKDLLEGARFFVDDVASRLRALDYRAKGAAVLGAPATVILQEATKRKADLILMGARGRRGITRFVLGSVSHAVLPYAPCPVLVFR